MEPGPVVVGIDIAASRPCVAVAVRCGRTLEVVSWREADEREPGDRARLFEWLDELGPVVVGVDAPQRPRRARRRRRHTAARLRRRAAAQAHLHLPGAHAGRRRGGGRPVHVDGDRLGVLPRAGPARLRAAGPRHHCPACSARRRRRSRCTRTPRFVTLLGGTPPPKSTPRRAARARRSPCARLGLLWDEYYDHDSLDALDGGAHGVALRAGPRDAARRRPRRLHLAAGAARRGAAVLRAAERARGARGRPPPRRLTAGAAGRSRARGPGPVTSRSC